MVRMDHLVLNSHIISTKQQDGLPTRMLEAGEVVDGSVNDDLSGLNILHLRDGGLGGRVNTGAREDGIIVVETLTELGVICIGCHNGINDELNISWVVTKKGTKVYLIG